MFEWLGQRIAVTGLETFDSVRGLKYLGMLYYAIPGGYQETTPSVYIDVMASMMGVTHAKTPTTPGIRPRQPTEAGEKLVDTTRERVFRAIVGKAQWILRARPVLYAVKELSRRLQGLREVDFVAAKRLVKYFNAQRWNSSHARAHCTWTALLAATGQVVHQRGSHPREHWCGCMVLSHAHSAGHKDSLFVVTRSGVLRMHSGSCRGKVCSIHSS